MKKSKKLLALARGMSMVVSLAACGGSGETTPAPEDTTPAETTPAETTPAEETGNKLIAGIVFQEDQFFKLLSAG